MSECKQGGQCGNGGYCDDCYQITIAEQAEQIAALQAELEQCVPVMDYLSDVILGGESGWRSADDFKSLVIEQLIRKQSEDEG